MSSLSTGNRLYVKRSGQESLMLLIVSGLPVKGNSGAGRGRSKQVHISNLT